METDGALLTGQPVIFRRRGRSAVGALVALITLKHQNDLSTMPRRRAPLERLEPAFPLDVAQIEMIDHGNLPAAAPDRSSRTTAVHALLPEAAPGRRWRRRFRSRRGGVRQAPSGAQRREGIVRQAFFSAHRRASACRCHVRRGFSGCAPQDLPRHAWCRHCVGFKPPQTGTSAHVRRGNAASRMLFR